MKYKKLMKILNNKNRAIDFLIDEGILKKEKECYKCKKKKFILKKIDYIA